MPESDFVQDVYDGIDADPEGNVLTITRERGTVITGSLTTDEFVVNDRAALADLVIEGPNVSSADDIRLTPGTGRLAVDALTLDDSTLAATDADVPLTLKSPAGILLDSDGDVKTAAAGSVLLAADAVDWNVVSTVRTAAADVLAQVYDTATLSAGEVASLTAGRLEANALGAFKFRAVQTSAVWFRAACSSDARF
jgi:hypothetical protein